VIKYSTACHPDLDICDVFAITHDLNYYIGDKGLDLIVATIRKQIQVETFTVSNRSFDQRTFDILIDCRLTLLSLAIDQGLRKVYVYQSLHGAV
jgi:hypothetical protein